MLTTRGGVGSCASGCSRLGQECWGEDRRAPKPLGIPSTRPRTRHSSAGTAAPRKPGEEGFQQSCLVGPDQPRPGEAPQPFSTWMLSVPSHQGRSEDTGAEEGKGFGMATAMGQGQEQKWPRHGPCPGHVPQLGKGSGMEITTPISLPQQTSPQEPGLTVGERVSQSRGGAGHGG